ncbi:hypothetical protein FRB99_008770 [Tulasnella sp. 403]|nr:hypothetical protein FRB99_008770 [Tulasnella sp. 403]
MAPPKTIPKLRLKVSDSQLTPTHAMDDGTMTESFLETTDAFLNALASVDIDTQPPSLPDSVAGVYAGLDQKSKLSFWRHHLTIESQGSGAPCLPDTPTEQDPIATSTQPAEPEKKTRKRKETERFSIPDPPKRRKSMKNQENTQPPRDAVEAVATPSMVANATASKSTTKVVNQPTKNKGASAKTGRSRVGVASQAATQVAPVIHNSNPEVVDKADRNPLSTSDPPNNTQSDVNGQTKARPKPRWINSRQDGSKQVLTGTKDGTSQAPAKTTTAAPVAPPKTSDKSMPPPPVPQKPLQLVAVHKKQQPLPLSAKLSTSLSKPSSRSPPAAVVQRPQQSTKSVASQNPSVTNDQQTQKKRNVSESRPTSPSADERPPAPKKNCMRLPVSDDEPSDTGRHSRVLPPSRSSSKVPLTKPQQDRSSRTKPTPDPQDFDEDQQTLSVNRPQDETSGDKANGCRPQPSSTPSTSSQLTPIKTSAKSRQLPPPGNPRPDSPNLGDDGDVSDGETRQFNRKAEKRTKQQRRKLLQSLNANREKRAEDEPPQRLCLSAKDPKNWTEEEKRLALDISSAVRAAFRYMTGIQSEDKWPTSADEVPQNKDGTAFRFYNFEKGVRSDGNEAVISAVVKYVLDKDKDEEILIRRNRPFASRKFFEDRLKKAINGWRKDYRDQNDAERAAKANVAKQRSRSHLRQESSAGRRLDGLKHLVEDNPGHVDYDLAAEAIRTQWMSEADSGPSDSEERAEWLKSIGQVDDTGEPKSIYAVKRKGAGIYVTLGASWRSPMFQYLYYLCDEYYFKNYIVRGSLYVGPFQGGAEGRPPTAIPADAMIDWDWFEAVDGKTEDPQLEGFLSKLATTQNKRMDTLLRQIEGLDSARGGMEDVQQDADIGKTNKAADAEIGVDRGDEDFSGDDNDET